MEEDALSFPDISVELPGIELAEHLKDVAVVTNPEKQASIQMQARLAVENVGLQPVVLQECGPHLIRAKGDSVRDKLAS